MQKSYNRATQNKTTEKNNKSARNICSKLHEAYVRTPKLISRNHLLLLEVLILYILKKKKRSNSEVFNSHG